MRFLVLCAIAVVAAPPAAGLQQSEPHWAIKLGLRVERVERAFPVVDQVVLVPDAATYLDELSRWSPDGRWPVLLEDDHLAGMFIRRFDPARVLRRSAVDGAAVSLPRLEQVVVGAWGGDPQTDTPAAVFARRGHVPPGVVIASARDPAWTAAVALAAGRGQPLAALDGVFARPNAALDAERFEALRAEVDAAVARAGGSRRGLGDATDAITLCRAVAGRARVPADGGATEIRAVTDLLGRDGAGARYAFVGWIFGDEARCAYTAMCSLFLARRDFLLYDTYSRPELVGAYGVADASPLLAERGFRPEALSAPRTGERAWLDMLPGGLATDVLVMNSRGSARLFHLADGRAYPGDVPILDAPAAIHFIHSYSFRAPEAADTVGGRWLARGAYAYVGSVDEPTLGGFVPPKVLADRWRNLAPFLIGARWWDRPPGRLNTYGDPLMICRPPVLDAPTRRPPPEDGAASLRQRAAALMRTIESDDTGGAAAESIRLLGLLGEDEIAAELWRLALDRDHAAGAAPAALGPLFRLKRAEAYFAAWRELPLSRRDRRATDMLWHLAVPQLTAAEPWLLLELSSVVRGSQPDEDLARLAGPLRARFGAQQARSLIERHLERTTNPRQRRALRRLLKDL